MRLKNLLRVKRHERGNNTSCTPCSTLTVVADMRSSHGWKHWAAEWLGWVTKTLGDDRVLLVEVADVADVQVRKLDIRLVANVDDVTTAPGLTELSRPWCDHETLALERSLHNHLQSRSF